MPDLSLDEANRDQIRRHCLAQGHLDESYVREIYASRLDAALASTACWPRFVPVPPGHGEPDEEEPGWIDPSRVVVPCGFTPYHHTRDEMLEYALERRGDAAHLLATMPVEPPCLYVRQYPTPPGTEPLYFVTTNGNHRRLVYHALGLPVASALVTPCMPGWWRVERSRARDGWVQLFEHLGLVDERLELPSGDIDIADPTGCLGWVVPSDQHRRVTFGFADPYELARSARAVVAHMSVLERLVGPIADPRVAALRDADALYEAMRKIYLPRWRGGIIDAVIKRATPTPAQGRCPDHDPAATHRR